MNHDKLVDEVRKAMIFKYGEKVSAVAAETVQEIAVVLSVKAGIHEVNPSKLLRCTVETMSAILRRTAAEQNEQAKKTEKN